LLRSKAGRVKVKLPVVLELRVLARQEQVLQVLESPVCPERCPVCPERCLECLAQCPVCLAQCPE